jgi:phosphatidylglycerol:prolipoprotein diacylglycerol transferase
MRPTLFHLGEIAVPSFWVMAFLGFFGSFLVLRSELVRRGYDDRLAYDMILWAYIGGWVGARLFIIPSAWDYFTEDPIAFLLSSSGWVWYGGLIGGAVAVCLWARRVKFPLLTLADMAGPALAVGLGIGRIGCQLAGDGDYGVPTELPWGMSYPDGVVPTTDRVHPAPVYEMVGCFALFGYLWQRRATAPPGDLFGRYLIGAGGLRFAIEFVRRNPAWLFGLTTAQWMSIGAMIVGSWFVRRARREAESPLVPRLSENASVDGGAHPSTGSG